MHFGQLSGPQVRGQRLLRQKPEAGRCWAVFLQLSTEFHRCCKRGQIIVHSQTLQQLSASGTGGAAAHWTNHSEGLRTLGGEDGGQVLQDFGFFCGVVVADVWVPMTVLLQWQKGLGGGGGGGGGVCCECKALNSSVSMVQPSPVLRSCGGSTG